MQWTERHGVLLMDKQFLRFLRTGPAISGSAGSCDPCSGIAQISS
jgi:hypothetical protein